MPKRPRGDVTAASAAPPSAGQPENFAAARRALPVWEARGALLKAVQAAPTLVLTGDTGCGKTTQIPQFLLAAGLAKGGLIGVTQPRRVAAMSVARRVASEQGGAVGERVGYCVRFDDCTSDATRIRYVTDGMLLREAIASPLLRRYAVLIVDEAHERSLQTDVALAVLKRAQSSRAGTAQPLKLLVMSATLQTETFCTYFGGAPAVQVLGRQYGVQVYYAPSPQSDYLEAAATAVLQIHHDEPAGDVLVFLTGQEDIEAVKVAIKQRASRLGEGGGGALSVLPLYAALPPAMQMAALQPSGPGVRKVILATNIAETSLTIDGIVYVVDCGLAKQRRYHAGKRIDSLLVTPISKAAARQRAGRAGRVQPGKCFRLYTEGSYAGLAEATLPEIQRTSLAGVLLSLKALDIGDVLDFDFVSPPSQDSLLAALEQLLALGALDASGSLSADGELMSKLPLEPSYSKALLAARHTPSLPHMLALLAMLSVEGAAFHAPPSERAASDEARRKFVSHHGDTLTLVNVLGAFGERTGKAARQWCKTNYVNLRTVETATLIRRQLSETCARLAIGGADAADAAEAADAARAREQQGLPLVDVEMGKELRRCLTAAFFQQAAQRQPSGEYLALVSRQAVSIHPGSVLFSRRAPVVLFNELLFTSKLYMRDLTQIDAAWLPELAPQFFAATDDADGQHGLAANVGKGAGGAGVGVRREPGRGGMCMVER